MVTSPEELCALAQAHMGMNTDDVEDISSPTSSTEKIFARHYDTTRRWCLKHLAPNFALDRQVVAKDSTTPTGDHFSYRYSKPSLCLKVLGIGRLVDKRNDYSVEGDYIYTDENYDSGMSVRYIKDITDVTKFSPEFVRFFSIVLARDTCVALTGDINMLQALDSKVSSELTSASALNAQENRPIRVSRSEFKAARRSNFPSNNDKA